MRSNRRARHARSLLGESTLTALDLGARGEPPQPWKVLEGVATFVQFDPDEEACDALQRAPRARRDPGKYLVLPVAIAGESGARTLYVTATPSGSSLFRPGTDLTDQYVVPGYIEPLREVPVEVLSLSDALDKLGLGDVHLAKLDIQGVELEVLKGLDARRRGGLLAVEVETPLEHYYEGAPTFPDLHAFMRDEGFELFNVNPTRVHRRAGAPARGLDRFAGPAGSSSMAARLWEFDALYFRNRPAIVAEGSPEQLLRYATTLCVYRYFAEAFLAVTHDEARAILTDRVAERAGDTIVGWHRSAMRPWERSTFLHLAHKAIGRAHVGGLRRWSQYEWRSYPHV